MNATIVFFKLKDNRFQENLEEHTILLLYTTYILRNKLILILII